MNEHACNVENGTIAAMHPMKLCADETLQMNFGVGRKIKKSELHAAFFCFPLSRQRSAHGANLRVRREERNNQCGVNC
jgi:hypothetical protein